MKIITESIIHLKHKSTRLMYRYSNPSDFEMQNHRNCQNVVLSEDIMDEFETKNNYKQFSNYINISK